MLPCEIIESRLHASGMRRRQSHGGKRRRPRNCGSGSGSGCLCLYEGLLGSLASHLLGLEDDSHCLAFRKQFLDPSLCLFICSPRFRELLNEAAALGILLARKVSQSIDLLLELLGLCVHARIELFLELLRLCFKARIELLK